MSSTTIATITTMLEALPDEAQEKVAERLREYIDDLRDEIKWSASYSQTQDALAEEAIEIRESINNGLSKPMDMDKL